MKKLFNAVLIVMITSQLFAMSALAQGETPYVIRSTQPISDELKDHIDTWLATDAPSSAPYYIVTYVQPEADFWIVSLAGVNLSSPDDDWNFEDEEKTVWVGTVYVNLDGSVVPFLLARGGGHGLTNVFATSLLAPGGGSYVAFPFQAGTAMIYGVRSVHGSGDYGTEGMLAVDLVSGDNMGPGAAPPLTFASDAGVIDYICTDGTTVAVRTYNATTADYFLYAHLLDNENLEISTAFERGELIGNLKYGTFDDDCGWAEQRENNYHLHWMFVPANGAFQAEGCILGIASKRWTCGTEVIGTGGWLKGGGGTGVGNGNSSGLDDLAGATGVNADLGFFDYFLGGVLAIMSKTILVNMPTHQEFNNLFVLTNTISLVMRIAHVVTRSNINLFPLFMTISWGIYMNLILLNLWIMSTIIKAVNELAPLL